MIISDSRRAELRLKQDFLLMLAVDMAQEPESFRIWDHAGAPTLQSLRGCIYPEWESQLDMQLAALAPRFNVGLPNFAAMALESA